jgi:hypothetical protein
MIGVSAVVSFEGQRRRDGGKFDPPADKHGQRDKNQAKLWGQSPHNESTTTAHEHVV